MFGRAKTETAKTAQQAATPAQVVTKPGGKGRPTPRRREVEQRNKRPIVGAPPPPGASKEEKRAAKQARRDAMRAERLKTRQALLSGDEKALPPRDRGPARRFARDYVDSRRSVGEFFLPIALVAVLLSLVNVPIVSVASLLMIYGTGLLVAADSFLLRRRVQRLATERFGADQARGTGTYAMMRALQLRRGRLPRPQVARGQRPV